MPRRLKAVVFTAKNQIKIEEFDLCACGPDDVVVRSLYTMVSSGTELRMLGSEKGFPTIPGYATIGEIIELGENVKGYHVGDLVSGRSCPRFIPVINAACGSHISLHVLPATGEDRPVLLPAGANPLDYIVSEIGSITLRGVEAAQPKAGETAVVIGQGLIGALSAGWLNSRGCRVIVTDFEQRRLDRALAWGAAAAIKGSEPHAEERIRAYLNRGADIVVESSGVSAGALLAYSLIRPKPRSAPNSLYYRGESMATYDGKWPRLVMQASYDNMVNIHPHGFYPGEGVSIFTPSDRSWEDRQKSVEGLRRGAIKASDFVDKIVPYTEAPQAYISMRDDKNSTFSLVFDWTSLKAS